MHWVHLRHVHSTPRDQIEVGMYDLVNALSTTRLGVVRGQNTNSPLTYSRSRRKKCSEGHPSCQLCTERGIECIYPDWTVVKFSQTRQRRRQLQDANIGRAVARPTLLPAQPSNPESRFIFHFNNILAGLISFSTPQAGTPNPFLQHVLPRASSSVQVQCAVEAVAAAHLYHLGAESGDRATQLHSKALNLLAVELSRPQLDETSRMNLLASSLLLIYYEVASSFRSQFPLSVHNFKLIKFVCVSDCAGELCKQCLVSSSRRKGSLGIPPQHSRAPILLILPQDFPILQRDACPFSGKTTTPDQRRPWARLHRSHGHGIWLHSDSLAVNASPS